MIIPSIDLISGKAVQLIGGREKVLERENPLELMRQFSIVGEVAVIDLDAALGQGENRNLILRLIQAGPCRVGGGIRSIEDALFYLNAGASKVIIGTKASPEFLAQLPRDRVIAALDAEHGEVVVEGWRSKTGKDLLSRLLELKPYVNHFLITFVEREGRMLGMETNRLRELIEAAAPARITFAGGVAAGEEVGSLERLGADAQVGMALYTRENTLAKALYSCTSQSLSGELIPTVVCDELGVALGLAWSNEESVTEALRTASGTYFSRRRGLWRKGETSGARQELLRIDLDCDRDCLRFMVKQSEPGFCHSGEYSCWGKANGITQLQRTLQARLDSSPKGSYVAQLLANPELLKEKILEEAHELIEARASAEILWEATDVLFFALVKAISAGVTLEQIATMLEHRAGEVSRRSSYSPLLLATNSE